VSGALGGAVRAVRRLAGTGVLAAEASRRLRRESSPEGEPSQSRAAALHQICREVLALHGLRVEVEGSPPAGPALLASNHVSWLDPLVVASLLPCVPISKLDVSDWPVVGSLARGLGVIFVRRGDPRSGAAVLRGAAAALSHGLPVLNFPEGTTTPGRVVLPFRRGIFGLARRAGVPVVPVTVRCDRADLAWVGEETFLPHYLRLAASPGCRILVTFGRAIAPSAHSSADALARAARDQIADRLGEPHVAAAGA
jgi:1-acyl-sn-glycerol-3-phosphate acyltransferase